MTLKKLVAEGRRRLGEGAVDPGRLKANANTVVALARDMAKSTDKPSALYAEAGNLLAQLGAMFDQAGDMKLSSTLVKLAGAVHKRGETHANDWSAG